MKKIEGSFYSKQIKNTEFMTILDTLIVMSTNIICSYQQAIGVVLRLVNEKHKYFVAMITDIPQENLFNRLMVDIKDYSHQGDKDPFETWVIGNRAAVISKEIGEKYGIQKNN